MPGPDEHRAVPPSTAPQAVPGADPKRPANARRPTVDEPDDDPALVHTARSLRAMADDERRSAAYARSAPVLREEDDSDSGGRAGDRGASAATHRDRAAEQHEAVASRYDQSRGDVSTSRRR